MNRFSAALACKGPAEKVAVVTTCALTSGRWLRPAGAQFLAPVARGGMISISCGKVALGMILKMFLFSSSS